MGFIVFEKGSAPIKTVPSVTIQRRGLFSINRAAWEMLGNTEAVELLWDADEKIIGFRPSDIANVNAYPVRPQATGAKADRGPLLIAGSLFTKFIGLDTEEAHRWIPYMDDDVMCIDLKIPGGAVTRNRRSRAEIEAEQQATEEAAATT
ncbi:hypothetical protein [Clavibacter michiganensis]|uniref:hypothetical protein n=1 Tax=Clavibacter michiganensis TaxID=28447 RepID=UPI00142E58A3|nr:hypothetical protein [Clavibacter michiganensis]NIY62083.1 hypothetical protein [Clavibacter michiganensis subsp. michiganensis]QIT13077.1 hypothetical protein GRD74_15940 [Clavibacter michiganensis subsp. michiganensis]